VLGNVSTKHVFGLNFIGGQNTRR